MLATCPCSATRSSGLVARPLATFETLAIVIADDAAAAW
jgi:hypothetical protein